MEQIPHELLRVVLTKTLRVDGLFILVTSRAWRMYLNLNGWALGKHVLKG